MDKTGLVMKAWKQTKQISSKIVSRRGIVVAQAYFFNY